MFKLCILPVLFFFCFLASAFAQDTSIVGKWKTIDDKTNEPKSIVQIYEQDGKYFGQIKELFRKPGEDPDPVCDKCAADDPRKDQPTKGMIIIKDLVKDGDEYADGTILDPKDGKIYDCKLWVEADKLMVRGYIAFFFRTQTWHRVE
ncbi:MAG: DUF2147 domain-containing protein [Proteobacteria bacterium]|nr:DUF2147 domain-containing protein [Pseudomonadota bacterium]MBU1582419.1 DUF2147 domain-containing protein [Pseudomonadota bacterium]MBU2453499.1 DUF2147 domain-containing protein [Pseudomonadota bacterium]MBU2628920.1 DUF2147 domain-containing protein [Pseudomonadota bacterium]